MMVQGVLPGGHPPSPHPRGTVPAGPGVTTPLLGRDTKQGPALALGQALLLPQDPVFKDQMISPQTPNPSPGKHILGPAGHSLLPLGITELCNSLMAELDQTPR